MISLVSRQGRGVLYAFVHCYNAQSKIRGRINITIGTWNAGTLRAAGKVQQLIHDVDRYRRSSLGLCEIRRKNSGETTRRRKDTRLSSVEKRIRISIVLHFFLQGMPPSLQQAHRYQPEGSPFQHQSSSSVRPNIRLWWQWCTMTSERMSLIRHRRRTFLSYEETGTQKWTRMLIKTVKPSAMTKQLAEDSDS